MGEQFTRLALFQVAIAVIRTKPVQWRLTEIVKAGFPDAPGDMPDMIQGYINGDSGNPMLERCTSSVLAKATPCF